ncbi:hypothetical protein [Bradyrhizobium sp. Cp5.3]|uniref:hypothetical protein n=1 Tax=Bradyrhizobium sp. Cp5.3 TaxID=443598 RepID=UPI000483F187|nr:hypothetical protein [Bradyrhizobium sp. Cp5.3]
MGQVIRLQRADLFSLAPDEDIPEDYHRLSKEELKRAISGCLEVRHQIGVLIELAVQAERMIDNVSDERLQHALREKRVRAHVELVSVLSEVSRTTMTLMTTLAGNAKSDE